MGLKLGYNAKLYRLSTGTRASWNATVSGGAHVGTAPGSLDEIPNVKDVTPTIEKTEANVTTRVNGGWEAIKGTMKKASIEFTMIDDSSDADLTALQTAFLTDATIALAVLDGDKATAGSQGIWADWEVTKMERGEPLEDAQTRVFTLKPGYSAVAPEWVKVA